MDDGPEEEFATTFETADLFDDVVEGVYHHGVSDNRPCCCCCVVVVDATANDGGAGPGVNLLLDRPVLELLRVVAVHDAPP